MNTQDPHIDPDYSVPEYRVQQDLLLSMILLKSLFITVFSSKNVLFRKPIKHELLNDFSFSYRFRYRLQATFDLWKKEKQSLKGTISDEIMFNFGKDNKRNTFDQNRIYAALRYHFNPNIGLELGYLKKFSKTFKWC